MTTKGIEALKAPAARTEIPDPALRGLYLVVQPSGTKSWALRSRIEGRTVKITLGKWPRMGLADARAAAAEVIEKIERGENPAAERKIAKAEAKVTQAVPAVAKDTVEAVVAEFEKRHLRHIRSGGQVMTIFRREIIQPWGSRPIRSITRRDCIELLDGILDRGSPIAANRARAHLHALMNWAVGRDIIDRNPLNGVRPPAPEKPRERVLSDAEIVLFWNACEGLGYPFRDAFRLLLLTGQRLREVCWATWREFDLDKRVWTLPAARSKNGDEHVIPLAPEAVAILEGLPRLAGCPFLFSTTGETPVSGFTRAKARLDAAMAKAANADLPEGADPVVIPPFTLHDLRRTAATGMAGLRFPPHVVEAVLNHRSGTRRGIASVYNRHDHLDEKREALTAWARRITDLTADPPSNVVELRAGDRA